MGCALGDLRVHRTPYLSLLTYMSGKLKQLRFSMSALVSLTQARASSGVNFPVLLESMEMLIIKRCYDNYCIHVDVLAYISRNDKHTKDGGRVHTGHFKKY
jgi:hypothetical protein